MRTLPDRHLEHLLRIIDAVEHTAASGLGFTTVGLLLDHVIRYLDHQFQAEERLMREHGFAGVHSHVAEHDACRVRLASLKADIQAGRAELAEATTFLRAWLGIHENRSHRAFRFACADTDEKAQVIV